jgi:phage-related minor tail protein
VAGGGSYIVGEAGPELFVPYRSGTIVNNFNLTANYQDRDRQSLAMDIKMLSAMYG